MSSKLVQLLVRLFILGVVAGFMWTGSTWALYLLVTFGAFSTEIGNIYLVKTIALQKEMLIQLKNIK